MRRAVAADDDLLLRVVQRVEGVKELGLRAFLPGQELDVIHEQDVYAPIAFTEIQHPVVANGIDHLVHEPLGRDVGQFQRLEVIEHIVPDRVHQVRLAEPHPTVNEQRIVGARGGLGDGAAGGMRELVRAANDEGVEGVPGSEAPGFPGARLRFEVCVADGVSAPLRGAAMTGMPSSVRKDTTVPGRPTSDRASSRAAV